MKVKNYLLTLIVVLFAGVLTNYSIYANDQNATDNFFIFLPITINPSEPLPEKTWTGIHLGNTVPPFMEGITPPWPLEMFDEIDPRDGDGQWPAVIVVQSGQLFRPIRSNLGECWVSHVEVNIDFDTAAFNYIKAAAQADIPIIVRITPSPGNFLDYAQPAGQQNNHFLVFDEAVTGDHCEFSGQPFTATYRSPLDVALEILAIQDFSKNQHGFDIFGFVPANEPNLEWYTNAEEAWPTPTVTDVVAWDEMATYFQKVFEWAHFYEDELDIRVMTPPMAQNLFAEGIDFFNRDPQTGICPERRIIIDPNQPNETTTGYELMKPYYQLYNDGVTWHNYWLMGRSQYTSCDNGGGHISYYFPDWLHSAIDPVAKPPFILEADIASPQQASSNANNPVLADKDSNPALTSTAIRAFFQLEYCHGGGLKYLANAHISSWLLYDNTKTAEHHWHMGYGKADPNTDWPNAEQRLWFPQWWGDSETLFSCPHSVPGAGRDDDNIVPTAIKLRQQTKQINIHDGLWSGYLFAAILLVITFYSSRWVRRNLS